MKQIFDFLPVDSDAFLFSTQDEFLGEYTPNCFKRLQFVTGFTGSYAFALIKKDGANKLFVDGRYTLQAKNEARDFDILPITNLTSALKGLQFTVDEKTNSWQFINNLKNQGLTFDTVIDSPIDKIWEREIDVSRETYNFELAGESSDIKIKKILDYISEMKIDAAFISDPHDVCHLFNIRGKYLKHSPIAPYFGIVSRETQEIISPNSIQNLKFGKVLIAKNAPFYVVKTLQESNEIIFDEKNFIAQHKLIKTDFEIECIKRGHIQDGKAIKEFKNWIKTADLKNETEFTIGEKLLECREKQNGFICESFPAIVGFEENSAIIHYNAKKENAKQIIGNGILLIDSGGQYYDKTLKICGTTDITRVFAIGEQAPEAKRAYTLVLKGHIALASAIFPEGTTGAMLDILARQFLWQEGLNYNHGTGHGVGYFLSVHEGSCGISINSNTKLEAGMIISNEPGFYEEGKFGVRFENLMLVKNSHKEGFLEFETLSRAEVEIALLDYDILTDHEIEWLTNYTKNLEITN